jgi:tRNA-specific 2-thiouridylase
MSSPAHASRAGRLNVLVAMSGGVDSSVAAALLGDQGHDVTGVTLKLWGGESDSGCCSVSDVEDARRVAAQLDIPHYVFNFADDFTASVVTPYVDAYVSGRTPNPCVECNRSIKFGRLLTRARALGFDAVATGHHARVRRATGSGDGAQLLRGVDGAKDQSYVLYMLGRAELEHTLLPVGELTKAEVRAHAARLGLRTAAKPESMDVCFITRGGRAEFLDARAPARAGVVVDTAGRVVGRHDGITRFTVGQRRGLGVAAGDRRYVVDVDTEAATVTIGTRDDLLRAAVTVRDWSFVTGVAPAPGTTFTAQVRAHGAPVPAELDGDVVRFERSQPRVAPGQVVALYDGDVLVGGGIAA